MDNLANKYRPKSWAEIIGQQAVISVLSRQIATKTFKQSYLFVGRAGCGKTSVARIFGDTLNGEGSDIIEIDAASNNGINNIRALITDAQQSAIGCDYKVYVIDECHQLTRAAWDAALKLIEEPPESSIFIFCTTNPNKIPETIMSRVQRFDFKSVDFMTIADRLEYVCNEEANIQYDRAALERIALMSGGCVRAGVQMLGQCIDSGLAVNLDNVESVLGVVKYDYLIRLLACLANKDLESSLNVLNLIKSTNSELIQIYDQMLEFFVEYAILCNTKNSNCCTIPKDICEKLIINVNLSDNLVNRFLMFRQYIDNNNVELMLKNLFMEICR